MAATEDQMSEVLQMMREMKQQQTAMQEQQKAIGGALRPPRMRTSIDVCRVSQHPIQLDPTLKNQGKSLIRDLRAQDFLRLRRAENGVSALDSAPEPLTETTPLTSTPVGSGEGVVSPGIQHFLCCIAAEPAVLQYNTAWVGRWLTAQATHFTTNTHTRLR